MLGWMTLAMDLRWVLVINLGGRQKVDSRCQEINDISWGQFCRWLEAERRIHHQIMPCEPKLLHVHIQLMGPILNIYLCHGHIASVNQLRQDRVGQLLDVSWWAHRMEGNHVTWKMGHGKCSWAIEDRKIQLHAFEDRHACGRDNIMCGQGFLEW